MTTWAVRTERDRQMLISAISRRETPFTANLSKGAPRSIEQNKLQRLWLKEAAEQGDMTAEEYRAHCKLTLGVPILRYENWAFADQYDEIVKPLPYESKLRLMCEPIDFPVTRLMTSAQKTEYLTQMYVYLTGLGFQLTDPNLYGLEAA